MFASSSSRTASAWVFASALLGAAAIGMLSPSVAHAGDDACTATKFTFPAVQNACKTGGRKAAKDLMKTTIKKAKDKNWKCTSCHEDTKGFKLKDNAVKDLKPYM